MACNKDAAGGSMSRNCQPDTVRQPTREGGGMEDIIALLRRASADDRSAIDELYAVLYADLHRMAHARLAENSPISMLDTTVLAHESCLRLRNAKRGDSRARPAQSTDDVCPYRARLPTGGARRGQGSDTGGSAFDHGLRCRLRQTRTPDAASGPSLDLSQQGAAAAGTSRRSLAFAADLRRARSHHPVVAADHVG